MKATITVVRVVRATVVIGVLASALSLTPLRSYAQHSLNLNTMYIPSSTDYGCGQYLTADNGPDSSYGLHTYFYTDSCGHKARAYATANSSQLGGAAVDVYLKGPGVNMMGSQQYISSSDTGYVPVSCGSSNTYQASGYVNDPTYGTTYDGPQYAPPVPFQVC